MYRIVLLGIALISLAGCASSPTRVSTSLDLPISFRGSTETETVARTIKSLSAGDAGEFQMANEIVRQKFEARRALPLTEVERQRAYVTVVDGMTPRQVILLGMMLSADRAQAGSSAADRREARVPREDHIQEHDDGNDTIVMDAMHRYTLRAAGEQ